MALFAHLVVAISLPLWLVVEQILHARSQHRIALAVREERRRVAESQRALAYKALLNRRAS